MNPTLKPTTATDAERSLINAVLSDPSIFAELEPVLPPEAFYSTAERDAWTAFSALSRRGEPIDLVELRRELERAKAMPTEGMAYYVGLMNGGAEYAVDPQNKIRHILEAHQRRRAIEVGNHLIRGAMDPSVDLNATLTDAENGFKAIVTTMTGAGPKTSKDLALAQADRLEALRQNQGRLSGVPTGIKGLDRVTWGLQRGNLIVLAARTSVGKTILSLHTAREAVEQKTVLIFSLEMSADDLWNRLTAAEARVNSRRFLDGSFTDAEKQRIDDANGRLYDLPFVIDDRSDLHHNEIRRRARAVKHQRGLGLVIIDHLQIVQSDRQATRDREIGSITAAMKAMAKDLDVPVLLLSQLNRALEARNNPHKRPKLSDLRDSGNIEQDADQVLMAYRPELYCDRCEWPPGSERYPIPGQFEIAITKNRNGPLGTTIVLFDSTTGRFSEMDET